MSFLSRQGYPGLDGCLSAGQGHCLPSWPAAWGTAYKLGKMQSLEGNSEALGLGVFSVRMWGLPGHPSQWCQPCHLPGKAPPRTLVLLAAGLQTCGPAEPGRVQ